MEETGLKKLTMPVWSMQVVKYECKKHGIVECNALVSNGEPRPYCPLCEAETEHEEELKQAEIKKIASEADKRAKNIEREYWGKTFDDFKIFSESQKKALEAVKQMVSQKHGKVILLGSNGCGKTMLGSIAVDMLGGKILSMYEITTMIRQSYTVKAVKTELELVSELASVPMLVIDELGRSKGSESELNWLSYILDKRHVRKLPFMLLTNTHLSSECEKEEGCERCFENFIDNDILSRLRQDSQIITIKAPDYRGLKDYDIDF